MHVSLGRRETGIRKRVGLVLLQERNLWNRMDEASSYQETKDKERNGL